MKISASVPDELWAQAAVDEASTSKVVQQALEALIEHRRQSTARVSSVETRLRTIYDIDDPDSDDVLDKLVKEARRLQRVGYMIGVDVAARIGWQHLEEVPTDLASYLRRWSRDQLPIGLDDATGNYEGLEAALEGLLDEYAEGRDPEGELITSTIFWDAIAAGVADARDAVREQLRNPTEGE